MNTTNPLNEQETIKNPTPVQVTKASKIMEAAVSTGTVSQAGYEWLKLATDPWHDNKVANFKGIPDQNLGSSVVMSVTQEYNVSKPVSYGAGNWNVRIANYPVASTMALVQGNLYGNSFAKLTPEASTNISPVVVDFSSGSADFTDFSNGVGLSIPIQYLKGPFKVAGVGIEVCNTTGEIYQQGLCSVATMNQCDDSLCNISNYDTTTNWQPLSSYPVRTVPKNLAELILLPNPTQWHAKEGHYSVVQLTSLDRVGASATPSYPIVVAQDFDSVLVSSTNPIDACAPKLSPVLTSLGTSFYLPQKSPGRVPCNSSVAMYTGLSDQTTLTIRVRWIVERFPNDQEPEILVLATPTAAYDPIALEIYSRVMRKLPSAVMFKDNNSMDFWKSVLVNLADVVSSGLLMLPHPLAKGAGIAINATRQYLAPDTKREFKIKQKKRDTPVNKPKAKKVMPPLPASPKRR
jgi:hypothetical protein